MIKQIKNSPFVKTLCLVIATAILNVSFISKGQAEIKLSSGTVISLENSAEINSENLVVGQTIDFFVADDVKVNGVTVIRRGAPAKAQVTRVQKAKGLGKEGSVEVEVKTVKAVDGTDVRLTSAKVFEEGEDRQTAAILLGILVCILFLTKKGKNAVIAPGTTIDGRVAQDVVINA